MEELLIQSGLTASQAETYLYLIDHGGKAPPLVAKELLLTRSNAYKVLDSLEELGLVKKQEFKKKFVYSAADPSALSTLVAEQRNQVIALEQNVKTIMGELRAKYRKSTASSNVEVTKGSEAIVQAYTEQAEKAQAIHFIKSRADIPFMGYETMDKLRHLSSKNGTQRFGITPAAPEAPTDPLVDKSTNLTRTPVPVESYTAPVEWSVSGDELLITKFDGEGECIRVRDPEIAEGFRQLWHITNDAIRR